jgi:hypothetical protein
LLPSFTADPPPAIKEHPQYLDQANASQVQALGAGAMARPFGYPASPNSVLSGVAGWMAAHSSKEIYQCQTMPATLSNVPTP